MRFRPGRPVFRRPMPLRVGPALFGGRSALAGAPLRQLEEAHRLVAAGQPAAAAGLFASLAQLAEANGMARRAAHLQLQLTRCFTALRDGPQALAATRAALRLFLAAGLPAQAGLLLARAIADLRHGGLSAQADELERDVQAQLGSTAFETAAAPARKRLPAKCPSCGGGVRSDEVEWIDESSAACEYCGSVIQAD